MGGGAVKRRETLYLFRAFSTQFCLFCGAQRVQIGVWGPDFEAAASLGYHLGAVRGARAMTRVRWEEPADASVALLPVLVMHAVPHASRQDRMKPNSGIVWSCHTWMALKMAYEVQVHTKVNVIQCHRPGRA